MKAKDFIEAMTTWADAEQRSTATLIEVLAAAALMKLKQPEGKEVVFLTINEADLSAVLTDYHYKVEYANDEMRVILTPITIDQSR